MSAEGLREDSRVLPREDVQEIPAGALIALVSPEYREVFLRSEVVKLATSHEVLRAQRDTLAKEVEALRAAWRARGYESVVVDWNERRGP